MSEELQAPTEPQEPAAPPPETPIEEPTPQAAAVDDDAAIDAEAIEIPTGEKLVPLSAVTSVREKYKAAKAENDALSAKASKAEQLEQQLQAAAPYIEAARAMMEAQRNGQQPQPQQPTGPTPEDTAALEEIARDFDFYKADGSLDLAKAERHQARTRAEAARIAQHEMQPLVQQSVQQRFQHTMGRLMNSEIGGFKPDPDILRDQVQRVASQPGGMETLANPEAAKHLYLHSLGLTVVKMLQEGKTITPKQQQALAQAAQQQQPSPALYIEKSGGATPQTIALTDSDRRLAKDLGMSEAEYQKEVQKMPAGWGGRR